MKVLIISNNCFSQKQNMGKTLRSLFEAFAKEELSQLYFYASMPDDQVCEHFYRISDYDLCKGGLFFSIGKIIIPEKTHAQTLFESDTAKQAYTALNHDKPSWLYMMRAMVWTLARWNHRGLHRWIESMAPDCLFFASGDTIFSYQIAYAIHKRHQIPMVSYLCDDYYHGFMVKDALGKCYHAWLKRWMHRVFEASRLLVSICEPLGERYQSIFHTPYFVAHTGTLSKAFLASKKEQSPSVSEQIAYLGNLQPNRWQSLMQIAKALVQINEEMQTEYTLEIYTGESQQEILEKLTAIPSVRLHASITPEQCAIVMKDCLAVIHTESFLPEDIRRVKYSMSTKIADSLASGTCLFAYGDRQIASIDYLIKHQAACVATSETQLKTALLSLLLDQTKRQNLIANAYALAKNNHVAQKNSQLLRQALIEAIGEKDDNHAN